MTATVKLLQFDDDTSLTTSGNSTLITREEDFGNPELYKKLFGVVVRYKTDSDSTSVPFFYSVDGGGNWTRFASVNSSAGSFAYLPTASDWSEVVLRPSARPVGTTFQLKFFDPGKSDIELQSLSYIFKPMNKAIG